MAASDLKDRRKVLEELLVLRSGLLDGEWEWSLESEEAVSRWEQVLDSAGPIDEELLALPLPDFALPLCAEPPVQLTVQYHSFSVDPPPEFAIHAASIAREEQARLVEELGRASSEAFGADAEYPVFTLFTSLRDYLSLQPVSISRPPPKPDLPSSSAPSQPTELRMNTVLIWSHHLLSTGKRKNIVAWSTELRLYGLSRPGYPGVIVVQGLSAEVDEFVRRIKQLQWKALQIRCEVEGPTLTPPSPPPRTDTSSAALQGAAEEWALRTQSSLGKVLASGAEGKKGEEKIAVREVAELGELGEIMTKAGLEDVFRTAMKL